jgi:hypothetical protein
MAVQDQLKKNPNRSSYLIKTCSVKPICIHEDCNSGSIMLRTYVWNVEKKKTEVESRQTKKNSVTSVRRRTIATERPLLVVEVNSSVCNVVSVIDPYGRILGLLDWSSYFFFQAAPQLYSRGWVDPLSDPLLLRKSASAGNRTRTSGYVARNSDH